MKTVIRFLCILAATLTLRGAETSGTQAATGLHRAIDRGDRPAWNRLLREGTDVTERDADGNTPLHLAALHGNADCVRALLDRGADANATNHVAATPLIYGITDADIVRALLKHHANPNAMTKLGMTPLLSAVTRGQSYEVAKQLIDAGADVQVTREGPWDGGALFRAIDLMQHSSEVFFQRRDACASCHNQLHPALACRMARERGFRVDELALGHQLKVQVKELDAAASEASRQLIFGGFAGAKGMLALPQPVERHYLDRPQPKHPYPRCNGRSRGRRRHSLRPPGT